MNIVLVFAIGYAMGFISAVGVLLTLAMCKTAGDADRRAGRNE